MYHHFDVTDGIFENVYQVCYQGKYAQLPEPLSLQKEPTVPYTFQTIILSMVPHPLKETLTEHTSTSSSTCISTRTRSMPRMSSRCVVVTHFGLIGEVKRDSLWKVQTTRSKLHDGPLRRKTASSLVGEAEVRKEAHS